MSAVIEPKRRTRRVSLKFMGEEWKDAYVDFRYLDWDDSKRQKEREAAARESGDDYAAIEMMRQVVIEAFVAGKIINSQDELVDTDAQGIGRLDIEALGTLYQRVLGLPDPNA